MTQELEKIDTLQGLWILRQIVLNLVFLGKGNEMAFCFFSWFLPIPESRGIQKMEIRFFPQKINSMSSSFGKKLVTLQETTKMSKHLSTLHVFDGKSWISFFSFPFFRVLPRFCCPRSPMVRWPIFQMQTSPEGAFKSRCTVIDVKFTRVGPPCQLARVWKASQ